MDFEKQLSNLDPEHVREIINREGFENLKLRYVDDDIDITAYPLAIDPVIRKKSRTIAAISGESFFDGAEDSIRDSINYKAKRYGKLDKPYLICINALSIKTSSGYDIENAICGSLNIITSKDEKENAKMIRNSDGIFYNNRKERITNVSGIFVSKVSPHNIHTTNYWLFKHPFTENDLNFDLLGLKYYDLLKNSDDRNVGDDLSKILNIEDDWLILDI